MATKKSAASTRKTTKKPATTAKKTTTTKVTAAKAASAVAAKRKLPRVSVLKAPLLTASVAEFLGTFLLAAVVIVTSGQPLFIMFAAVMLILAFAGISGAQLNPAITIGALATRRINLSRAAAYIGAQILGALLALVVLNGFISAAPAVTEQAQAFGQSAPALFTVPEIAKDKQWVILAAELLGTVILAFGTAASLRSKNEIARAFTFGGALYIAILVAGTAANYVSGGVVLNPAVAAAVQAFKEIDIWSVMVYAITPLVGGVLGFTLYDILREKETA